MVVGESAMGATGASPPSALAMLQRKVDRFVEAVMKCHNVPALSLSVVRDGQVTFTLRLIYVDDYNTMV